MDEVKQGSVYEDILKRVEKSRAHLILSLHFGVLFGKKAPLDHSARVIGSGIDLDNHRQKQVSQDLI